MNIVEKKKLYFAVMDAERELGKIHRMIVKAGFTGGDIDKEEFVAQMMKVVNNLNVAMVMIHEQ